MAAENFVNALLQAVQGQRDEALNKLAHEKANNAVLTAQIATLRSEAKDQKEEQETTP